MTVRSGLSPDAIALARYRLLLWIAWAPVAPKTLKTGYSIRRPTSPTAAETALKSASPSEAFLVSADQKPARMRVIVGGGAPRFIAPTAPAWHDWSAPPVAGAHPPEAPEMKAVAVGVPSAATAKLRRVLTRAVAKSANKGARTK